PNSVTASELADGAVDTAAIQTGAVTGAKILDGSIAGGDLAANTIGDAQITDDALTAASLATNSVGASELADDAVDTAAIQDGAVTGAKIGDTLTDAQIQDDALTAASLAPNSVGASELADGAVDGAAIALNAVTSTKIQDGTIVHADVDTTNGSWTVTGFDNGLRIGALNVGGSTISGVNNVYVKIDDDNDDPDGGTTATFQVRHPTGVGTEGLFRVREDGDLEQKGTLLTGSQAFDLAEYFPADEALDPADVVEIAPDAPLAGTVRRSRSPRSPRAIGVVTTAPGIVLGGGFADETYFPELVLAERQARRSGDLAAARALRDEIDRGVDELPRVAVALAGRVPVKVTAEGGAIEVGDLLTTSSTPGHAMRHDPDAGGGVVVGKAMEAHSSGAGTILMFVASY
ncbi:MAG: hypothetical protein ACF8XB_13620, partial [Planctomycetota bacterium JB042]